MTDDMNIWLKILAGLVGTPAVALVVRYFLRSMSSDRVDGQFNSGKIDLIAGYRDQIQQHKVDLAECAEENRRLRSERNEAVGEVLQLRNKVQQLAEHVERLEERMAEMSKQLEQFTETRRDNETLRSKLYTAEREILRMKGIDDV